jgi:hypothetical protein
MITFGGWTMVVDARLLVSKAVDGAVLPDFLTRKWWSGDHGDHDPNPSLQYTSCFLNPVIIL